jgi:thiosulfate dehydrogenase [quinone] large subunit
MTTNSCQPQTSGSSVRSWSAVSEDQARRTQPAHRGLGSVFLLIGYEWLLSGMDKVLSHSFQSDLADMLLDSLNDNPNTWFVSLMERLVVPHASLVAFIVTVGELLVAVGFVLGAVFWVWGDSFPLRAERWIGLAVVGALLGGAFMTANYYLLAGNTLPGLNPGDPFDEGLSIDGLLTLIALAMIPIQIMAMRARTAEHAESVQISGARRTHSGSCAKSSATAQTMMVMGMANRAPRIPSNSTPASNARRMATGGRLRARP